MNNISKKNTNKFLLNHFCDTHPIDWDKAFKRKAPLIVEIGFGNGDYLVSQAKKYPHKNFIGIEIEFHLIKKITKRIQKSKVKNIRLLCLDAYVAFDRLFKNRSIQFCYSLFPFPWPKKRHHKKRLFHKDFLRIVNSRLKSKGQFQIVTDFKPYFEWTIRQASNTGFTIKRKRIETQFDTRFERMWSKEGQNLFFSLTLTKKEHSNISISKQAKIGTVVLLNFDPDKIKYKNKKEPNMNIIFKKFSFDKKKNEAIQKVVICEPHLTQLFDIIVLKDKNKWKAEIRKSHRFISTEGLRKCLEIIKERS